MHLAYPIISPPAIADLPPIHPPPPTHQLQANIGHVEATSCLYESKAQYVTEQPDFMNAVCRLQTPLEPLALLHSLKHIETQLGRTKAKQRFGPRAVDLDILLYKDEHDKTKPITVAIEGQTQGSEEGSLHVPHVRLHEREFVLRPLADLAPTWTHPHRQQTVAEMLRACERARATEDAPPLVRVLALPSQGNRLLPLDPVRNKTPTVVMGILNVTPDSFSDGGQDQGSVEAAVARALTMVEEGADILDVGGESTRPGAAEVDEAEERARVLPVIERIRAQDPQVLISIDTRRATVAQAAVQAGADMVNDVSGGSFDAAMLPTVAALGVPYVLMHMRGTPQTMTKLATYSADPVQDVAHELNAAVARAEAAGVRRWSLLLDPGIGFAKDLAHNVALLRGLDGLEAQVGGLPLVVGVSRKRFIGTLCDEPVPAARDVGSSVANALAIAKGASMVRVHNVKMAVQTARLADALR